MSKMSNYLDAPFDCYHRYYVTAAPQCVFPDGSLGAVINSANFDAIYGKLFLIYSEESVLIDI
jgi:hypothetical protein